MSVPGGDRRSGPSSHCVGGAHGSQDCGRLVLRLRVLDLGYGIGHDPGSRLHVRDAALDERRTDRDRRVRVAGEVEVADGTSVHSASGQLQLVDDLHRAHLRRPGERPGAVSYTHLTLPTIYSV